MDFIKDKNMKFMFVKLILLYIFINFIYSFVLYK